SYDLRGRQTNNAKLWSSPNAFGPRAFFQATTTPAFLFIDHIELADEGIYRCRVDFKNSPTRNSRVNFTVIARLFEVFMDCSKRNRKNRAYRKSLKDPSIEQNNSKTYTHDQYNLEKLKNDSIKFSYQLNIADRMRNFQQQTRNDIYEELKIITHEAAHEVLGEKPKKEKGSKTTTLWWNDDQEKAVMKKKEAHIK
ncbi:hypothetical protein HHI36_000429, partial [Cryptolaemus montrouzieri]